VVWVVDDSRLDAERARCVLGRDYELHSFHDGSAALEQLASGAAPDVMVLDWVMPGVSGLDVCRFLRAAGSSSLKIGILLLTVHRDTDQIVEGLSAGANDYLAKPYEDAELRARVSSLMRTRELVERLEKAEAENRRLLETAPDPLLVSDGHGCLTFVNECAARAFGSTRDALVGRSLAELVPELGADEVVAEPSEPLLPLADVSIGQRRFSPTRRRLDAADNSSTIISLRDVTERRVLEERRLDFYSIIAHDLRTPLHAMTLRLAAMLERARIKPSAPQVEDLQKLDSRLGSLVALINDFLDLASLEGASYRIERSEVDVVKLIDQAREDFAPLLEKGGHTFRGPIVERRADAIVHGDERRLVQVVSNLISNAIKFIPRPGTITAHVRAEERYVEVSIEDNGSGIAPRLQGKLFQRYARAEQTVGGTGLGLLIVREIVEAHGGLVGFESSESSGSRFWFRLPRVRGAVLTADSA
jgi:two-component system phosphate regulon sensor histidine kinase PhoR